MIKGTPFPCERDTTPRIRVNNTVEESPLIVYTADKGYLIVNEDSHIELDVKSEITIIGFANVLDSQQFIIACLAGSVFIHEGEDDEHAQQLHNGFAVQCDVDNCGCPVSVSITDPRL